MVDRRLWAILVLVFVGIGAYCPDGWTRHKGVCYHFSHDRENWPGALAICREIGGSLVEVNNAAEGHYLAEQVHLYQKAYWIALTDIVEEGTWNWMVSHDPLTVTNYTDWAPKQPDNGGGAENCVEWSPGSKQWNDLECSRAINYICEKQDFSGSEIVG